MLFTKAQGYWPFGSEDFLIFTKFWHDCDQGHLNTEGLIRPPLEPKTESCFSPISSGWLFRRITREQKSGIYSFFTIVIVTKMASKIGLK